ncbi:hypothetical protein NL676_035366 [Syzygium grande]|nr:hypothetical protein NL676_035366 [Syzygium grande]
MPIVFPALEKNARGHWNPAVLNLTLSVKRMFSEMDEELFLSCLAQSQEEGERLRLAAEKRNEAWRRLETEASHQPVAHLLVPLERRHPHSSVKSSSTWCRVIVKYQGRDVDARSFELGASGSSTSSSIVFLGFQKSHKTLGSESTPILRDPDGYVGATLADELERK